MPGVKPEVWEGGRRRGSGCGGAAVGCVCPARSLLRCGRPHDRMTTSSTLMCQRRRLVVPQASCPSDLMMIKPDSFCCDQHFTDEETESLRGEVAYPRSGVDLVHGLDGLILCFLWNYFHESEHSVRLNRKMRIGLSRLVLQQNRADEDGKEVGWRGWKELANLTLQSCSSCGSLSEFLLPLGLTRSILPFYSSLHLCNVCDQNQILPS